MTLREYASILRRNWLFVGLATVLGASAAYGLSALVTPVYQAQAQLFVSVQSADEISGAYTGGLYVQQRIKSYVALANTPDVLDGVAEELDPEATVEDLTSKVTAQNPTGTVLIDVYAIDPSPEAAAALADATAESLAALIEKLERTESGTKQVQVDVVRPAEIPAAPLSPRIMLNVALGAVLGLMSGAGVALLRASADTTVKSADMLEDATGSTVLGSVSYDSTAAKSPLVTLRGAPRAEAYKAIRTNLKFVDVDRPPRCVVVTSSLPMEGKSTTSVNLAIALAQEGSRVLLVETDLRRPRVAEYLGVDGLVGLTDVLIGRARLSSVIIPWHRGLLDFLPSGAIPPNPSELLGSQQLSDLLTDLRARYDFLILDAAPLLPVTDAAILTAASDGAILVVRYGKTRREQARQATAALEQVNGRLIGTVLNFAPEGRRSRGYEYSYEYGLTRREKRHSGRRLLAPEDSPVPDPS